MRPSERRDRGVPKAQSSRKSRQPDGARGIEGLSVAANGSACRVEVPAQEQIGVAALQDSLYAQLGRPAPVKINMSARSPAVAARSLPIEVAPGGDVINPEPANSWATVRSNPESTQNLPPSRRPARFSSRPSAPRKTRDLLPQRLRYPHTRRPRAAGRLVWRELGRDPRQRSRSEACQKPPRPAATRPRHVGSGEAPRGVRRRVPDLVDRVVQSNSRDHVRRGWQHATCSGIGRTRRPHAPPSVDGKRFDGKSGAARGEPLPSRY